jgi:competence protein ComEC
VPRIVSPPHLLVAAYNGGLCASLVCRPPGWVILLLVACVAGGLALSLPRGRADTPSRSRLAAPVLGLVAVFLVAGVGVGGARLAALERSALAPYVGRGVDLRATLVDLPQVKDDRVTLVLAVTAVGAAAVREPARLTLQLEPGEAAASAGGDALVEGALLSVSRVRVEPLPPPRPGVFDYGRYLRRRGEHVLLEASWSDVRVTGQRGGLQGLIDRLRAASRAHLRAAVHAPVSDILQGMVLGDDEGVDQASIDAFRRSGLLHIMAVSGENVVLLCGMWSFAFSLLAIPRLARTLLLLPVVVTYVVLTGASPSIVRAGVSGVLGLFAILASRPADGWLLWLAPAAWLLTLNPNNIFDVSFQLSFAAVAGLLLLARPLTRLVSFLPGPLPAQIGITTAASLSTAPISMLTFGSASLVAVPANVAGGFALGPIMFFGMLSLLAGFVSGWASGALNVLAGLFIGFLLDVAHFFSAPSWAVWEWQGVSLRLLLAAGLLLEAGVLAWLANRAGGGLRRYVSDRRRRWSLVAVTVAVVALALALAPVPARPPDRPTLTFLSVGEGAAALLQAPRGPTVLIDAGPAPLAQRLREHAVRRIDLLVLSHGHADHTAGLSDVIGRVPIAIALLPRTPQPSAALDELAAALRATGTQVRLCDAATSVGGAGWGLSVLPTSAPGGEDANQAENDAALVVVADVGGQKVLVPGDAEGEVLARLSLPRCAVVELPHHGSRGGLDERELAALGPLVGVVSVGPNTYGHPTAEMLSLLSGAGIACARTDQAGDVAVSGVGGSLRVVCSQQG